MGEKLFHNRDWKYKAGLIQIIFWSIFIGVFHIGVLYLFGIPILGLLIGIIFIWFAKESLKTKILLTFLPIPIVIATFFLNYQLNKAEPEVFFIPQNYRGEVILKFNEPCGDFIKYDRGKRIYYIPEDGVLTLNGKQTEGFIDRKYFLIDDEGNLTRLPEFYWSKYEDEENQFNSIFSRNALTKELVGVFSRPSNIDYQRLTITSYQLLEIKTKENSANHGKQFQENFEALLQRCRK
jgi:hypothetical protein